MTQRSVQHSSNAPWRQGTIPAAGSQLVGLAGAPLPMSITLKSSSGSRLIELSTDGGTEYFTPSVTTSSATMQIVVVTAPVSGVRFTGAENDVWSVR